MCLGTRFRCIIWWTSWNLKHSVVGRGDESTLVLYMQYGGAPKSINSGWWFTVMFVIVQFVFCPKLYILGGTLFVCFFCSHWKAAPRWQKWLDGKLFSGAALMASFSGFVNRVRKCCCNILGGNGTLGKIYSK